MLEHSFSLDEVESRRGAFAASQLVSPEYRTYGRRWFGLAQLTLMNVVISWNWLTFAPVANFSASYYGVETSTINWISTIFFLAFVAIFPVATAALHHGLKPAFVIASLLIITGNWLRYAASFGPVGGHIAFVMLGEILIGFAQPFILAAPTRFSDLWFTSRGRVAATAVMSLANPLGGALGQLINPLWVAKPSDVSRMVLRVSIISTACCVPAFFVPSAPPTPVGPSSKTPKLNRRDSIAAVVHSREMWLILIPFFVYVGFFNSCSALLSQIMSPYGFSDDQAGIGGAMLILSGLVFAAIACPIVDRTKTFTAALKLFVPVTALSYLVLVWMPGTRSVIGPYFVLAILGAASFALLPIALELLIELSHPMSPEVTSTTAWAGGQLCGALFVIISDFLKAGDDGDPPRNLRRALIFQAVIAMLVGPLPLLLGLFGRENKLVLRRVQSDERDRADVMMTGCANPGYVSK